MVQEKVIPIEKKMFATHKKLILNLDRSMFVAKLTNQQHDKYGRIMFDHADSYLSVDIDDEIKVVFDKYSDDDESFDELKAEGENEGKLFIIEMFKTEFGIDIDIDDIEDINDIANNPKLFEKMGAAKEKHIADKEEIAQKKAEEEAKRKKTDKQIKQEEHRKTIEAAVSKTTKQIYMDLVKNFHPDTEKDEAKKLWKTEIMQQITVAYSENNYVKLLELQMTLLEDRENALEKFDDKELKHFNDALKNQINDLEIQLQMASPTMNPMYKRSELFSFNRSQMLRNVNKHIKDHQHDEKIYKNAIEYIQTLKGFKEYIKQYQLDAGMSFDIGLLLDSMRFQHR